MKRHGYIYENIISIENLERADAIAQRGKKKQYGVITHNKNRAANIQALHEMLVAREFKTSKYTTFKVYEPKERIVYSLPYFPDRILHHAIMLQLQPILGPVFTSDTYSCIKGRGLHAAVKKLRKALNNVAATRYCLKIDIRKYYPSVDHPTMKALLRRKIKDNDVLDMLDEIIDSADGLPIGHLLSQSFSTFYLTYFDHWMKEKLKVKYYFRYADDIVVLCDNKPDLHRILAEIKTYLGDNLKLEVKQNYQVFPVAARGIDFLGYVSYHTHTRLRKSIKKRFAKSVSKNENQASLASYMGWAGHANAKHLCKKLLPNGPSKKFQRLRDQTGDSKFHRQQNSHQADSGQKNFSQGFQT